MSEQVVAKHVKRIAMPGAVSESELARVKTQLKASLMQQLNTFAFVAEDIGRQVLIFGRRVPALEVFARIDAVTLEDLTRTAARFENNKVAVAALGKIDQLPSYEWVSNLLK